MAFLNCNSVMDSASPCVWGLLLFAAAAGGGGSGGGGKLDNQLAAFTGSLFQAEPPSAHFSCKGPVFMDLLSSEEREQLRHFRRKFTSEKRLLRALIFPCTFFFFFDRSLFIFFFFFLLGLKRRRKNPSDHSCGHHVQCNRN